ncbi:hypothetical protein AURDEDRAFT_110730 [Auricularia subglabra TFB-10046 SS5]|nr:hypothetical protein AURDEDRAFT_110730 [Auricularia subglabra TFB-10046 SS5]
MAAFLPRRLTFASFYASSRAVLRSAAPAVAPGSRRWKADMLPRNNEIPFSNVHVVDEAGRLGPLEPLRGVIERAGDPKVWAVQLRSRGEPIVQIVNRHEARAKLKEQRAREKAGATKARKTIQFTWGVDRADLVHKLKRARQELERRSPVDIALLHRKNQPVGREARQDVLNLTKDILGDLAIFRKMESGVGRTTLVFDLNHAALKDNAV